MEGNTMRAFAPTLRGPRLRAAALSALALVPIAVLAGCFGLRASTDAGDGGEEGGALDAGDAHSEGNVAQDADATTDADAYLDSDAASDSDAGADADSANAPDVADAPGDVSEGCAPAMTATDFYVDPSGGACTFRTITLALEAVRASTVTNGKTIHVAPGMYSAATGETFPLDLRGGIALIGAGSTGSTATILHGAGLVPAQTPPQNAHTTLSKVQTVSAVLLVGDTMATSGISGLALQPPPGAADGLEAIVCSRGNAGPLAHPPNTIIDGVTIEGFEIGIRVTWSSAPLSGCNALVLASTVRDGLYGVVADGDGELDANQVPTQFVSVTLGNGSAAAKNSFLNLSIRDASHPNYFNGAGFTTCDAVNNVVVRGNRFAQEAGGAGDQGILAVQHPPYYSGPAFDIEANEFGPLGNVGLGLWGNVTVDRLVGNSFHDISTPSVANWLGVGLGVSTQFVSPPAMAALKYVRGNTFFSNDAGVYIDAVGTSFDTSLGYDFGTASDPGNNTFRCNTVGSVGPDGPGGDFLLGWFQQQVPALNIPAEGNTWDHSPPTTWVSAIGPGAYNPPIGMDLYLTGTTVDPTGMSPLMSAGVDAANATASATPPCPPGRPAGP
jgi:hypothetical protein